MRSHAGVSNSLHHKYAIIDANVPASNPLVLTGSHNWSSNAENNSDENTLFIYNETIANIYLQEFEKRWSELGNSTSLFNQEEQTEVIILPNPTNERVAIQTKDKIINVVAFNSNGEPIFESQRSTLFIKQKGVYFLKITTEKGVVIRKVVIN